MYSQFCPLNIITIDFVEKNIFRQNIDEGTPTQELKFLHFFGIFMFLQFLHLLGIYNFQNYVWTSLVYQTCSKVEMFGQNKGTLYVES